MHPKLACARLARPPHLQAACRDRRGRQAFQSLEAAVALPRCICRFRIPVPLKRQGLQDCIFTCCRSSDQSVSLPTRCLRDRCRQEGSQDRLRSILSDGSLQSRLGFLRSSADKVDDSLAVVAFYVRWRVTAALERLGSQALHLTCSERVEPSFLGSGSVTSSMQLNTVAAFDLAS